MDSIRVYGADWCEDTQQTLQQLNQLGVSYDYINIDDDPDAAAFVREHNGGKQQTPLVDLDGQMLIEPDEATLLDSLRDRGLAS